MQKHLCAACDGAESTLIAGRARAQGKQAWRPAIAAETQARIAVLRQDGVSINKVAKQLGIAYATAHKHMKALEA